MRLPTPELLRRLGCGQTIASVCSASGIDRDDFDRWWMQELEARVPQVSGVRHASVNTTVEIARDRWGIPHIFANDDHDLFFGFGYAIAQDRLFQLDYLRRKGLGRLSEILGRDGLHFDRVARTVGLNRIARAEWEQLDEPVQQVLQSFSAGINAVIEEQDRSLPIEFSLLDYRPEPWTPVDCLAIENEFRWYLTGRFPIIVIPELAKRALGEGPRYRECITGEADEEAILWPGDYSCSRTEANLTPVGETVADSDSAIGSNNWVVAGSRAAAEHPLLASDPHIAFEAVSCWYEVHLCGESWNVAGTAYAGIPAVLIGRNERVAWGITNNICSQRDLYQEKTDANHSDCFLYDGRWEPAHEVVEVIEVRGDEPVTETIRFSRNGPIVDTILPEPARDTGPVSLKWLGAYQGGWLAALLGMARSENADELREATRPWHVPTFSVVFADVNGQIGLQATGRIPIRDSYERGYRPGWDPAHQWQGLIPFDDMPHSVNPGRGWIATANNRVAGDDFPYPLFGCWASGWRAMRVRQLIEEHPVLSTDDMRRMQRDTKSLRAATAVPALLAIIDKALSEESSDKSARLREAADVLRAWDFNVEVDSPAAAIFNVFFAEWCNTVANEHFDGAAAALLGPSLAGCAVRLLTADAADWFGSGDRQAKIMAAVRAAMEGLSDRLGPVAKEWTWGQLHRMPLRHVLAARGDLGELLNYGSGSVPGDSTTVANTGSAADFCADAGGGYRMVVDLGSCPPELTAVDAQSQSGNPGSTNYRDQLQQWSRGEYHSIPLDAGRARTTAVAVQQLLPNDRPANAE